MRAIGRQRQRRQRRVRPAARAAADWRSASAASTSGAGKDEHRPQRQAVDAEQRRRLHQRQRRGQRIAENVPRETGQDMSAQPFGHARARGETSRRASPAGQQARASSGGGRENSARPAGRQRHRERQQPGELLGLDEKRFADPEQTEEEIAKAEPPAGGGRRAQRAGRCRAAGSISQTRTGSVRNSTGERKNGANASTDSAPAANATSCAPPARRSMIAIGDATAKRRRPASGVRAFAASRRASSIAATGQASRSGSGLQPAARRLGES